MTSKAEATTPASRNVGSQTLARGLRALEAVASNPHGLSIAEVATELDVHRTIAYRILSTLTDFRLTARSADGRYRAGAGLTVLARGVQGGLRDVAEPVLRDLARSVEATVSLLVEEGDEAVAVAVIEPPQVGYHLTFHAGSRHPVDRGAAGLALLAGRPPSATEPEAVTMARGRGYALTFGEVEPGAYGIAAPLARFEGMPGACINIITNREDVAERSVPALVEAVRRLNALLA